MKIDTAEDKALTISQPVLTDQILNYLVLLNDSKQHITPTVSPPIQAYDNSLPPFKEKWDHITLIHMLTNLAVPHTASY